PCVSSPTHLLVPSLVIPLPPVTFVTFFFSAPAPPYFSTLSLHDALPISLQGILQCFHLRFLFRFSIIFIHCGVNITFQYHFHRRSGLLYGLVHQFPVFFRKTA